MANAQSDVATRLRSRKWVKVSVTSCSFIAAVVGAFYVGSQHNAALFGNARQSISTPAPVDILNGPAQATNKDAEITAATGAAEQEAGSAVDGSATPSTDRDVYARDLAEHTSAENSAYGQDKAWQEAENAAIRTASPAVKDALTMQAVGRSFCRNVGPKPDGSGPCAAQADAENKLATAGWCFNGDPIANTNTPYWHECKTAIARLPNTARQALIEQTTDNAEPNKAGRPVDPVAYPPPTKDDEVGCNLGGTEHFETTHEICDSEIAKVIARNKSSLH